MQKEQLKTEQKKQRKGKSDFRCFVDQYRNLSVKLKKEKDKGKGKREGQRQRQRKRCRGDGRAREEVAR